MTLTRNGIVWSLVDDGTLDTVVRVEKWDGNDLVATETHRFDYFAFWGEGEESEEEELSEEEREGLREEEIEMTLASMWRVGDLFTRLDSARRCWRCQPWPPHT